MPRGSDTTPKEIEYILGHSGAAAAFVEDNRRLGRVLEMRERLPELRLIVVLDPGYAGELPCDVHRLEDLIGKGRALRAGGDRRLEESAGRRSAPTTSRPSSTPRAPPASRRGSCSRTAT